MRFLISFLLLFVAACEKDSGAINTDNGLAVKGYDVIAYFDAKTPTEGSQEFTHDYQGATYQFASEANKQKFAAAPEKFVPQYGGYCAFGVTQEKKIDIDPNAWEVYNGKLYLNYTPGTHKIWKSEKDDNIEIADEIWPGLK